MIASATEPGSQTDPLLSTQSAAANNARATDRACAVVRYSSWSADSHTPTSPLGFCTAATSAEKPSSPRSGGQCGPKWRVGPVSPAGCSVWHQLGQVVDVMPSILRQPQGLGRMGGMRQAREDPSPWMSLAASPRIWPAKRSRRHRPRSQPGSRWVDVEEHPRPYLSSWSWTYPFLMALGHCLLTRA